MMPSSMAPQPPAAPQGQVLDNPQQRMDGFLNMVQQVHMMTDDIASQYPEAAAGCRRVKQALESLIMDVVKSPAATGNLPVPPRIVG